VKAVIPPYIGEFGWFVLSHLRYVEWLTAEEKIVCCQPGEEALYPSATGFFTDWVHPIPDSQRCGGRPYNEMRERLQGLYPEYTVVEPKYDCIWHWSDGVKPKLVVPQKLPKVNIALAPRFRKFGEDANWEHWAFLVKTLRKLGFTVGLVGTKDTSHNLEADACAWDHPDGATSGSIDILLNCGLYAGGDTGSSHLAALMDTPMVVFPWRGNPGRPDLVGTMQRANKNMCKRLPDDAWKRPDEVLGSIIRFYCIGSRNPLPLWEGNFNVNKEIR
jgi:ADP-heptose:LPS heptosyltransferase